MTASLVISQCYFSQKRAHGRYRPQKPDEADYLFQLYDPPDRGSRHTSARPARAEIRGVASPLLSPVGGWEYA
jgi:hypothetical protein